MPKERDFKFIIVTKGEFFPTTFGEWLNTFGWTDCTEVHFKILNIPKDGFYVPHNVITMVKQRFREWQKNFEFYVQGGQGVIRAYCIPDKKNSAAMQKAKSALKKIQSMQ